MTREESNAYARGYGAGVRGKWPLHKIIPPVNDSSVRAVLIAGVNLRSQSDALLATFTEGDCPELAAAIDEFDEAVVAFNKELAKVEERVASSGSSP